MKVAEWSVKKPITIVMLIVAVVLFGIISLPKLKVDLLPEMNIPVAVVATSYEGAAPEEVENLITKPMEGVIGTVSNIKKIRSVSINGASQIIAEFNWGTDMDQAALDMREKVDLVRGGLPKSAGSPRVIKIDPNSTPIISLALSGPMDVVELNKVAKDLIKSRIERVDGVASVGITGGKTREIQLTINPNALNTYGLTVEQITQSLSARNLSGTAGSVTEGDRNVSIKVTGEFDNPQDIGTTPIALPQGGTIQLADLLTVTDGYKKVTQIATVNNQPSLGISVTKASGANTVEVANKVMKELEALKPQLPQGMKLDTIMDTSVFIKDSISTVAEHALVGGLFAVVILYLFLHSFRSMLVVAIVIPISVVATFALMYFGGQTINLISLAGLTLGLGSLVDFAVVVLESIYRKRQAGLDVTLASIVGAKEVGTAVMASALAQICVFLPIVFVEGLAAQLFGPLALTVVFSHIAALLASITLVPMMASKLLKEPPREEEDYLRSDKKTPMVLFQKGFYRVSKAYGRLISWAISHRKTVILSTIIAMVVAIGVFASPLIGKEFLSSFDQGDVTVSVKLPPGSKLEETEKIVHQVEKFVNKIPEKSIVYTTIGSSGGPDVIQTQTTHMGSIQLKLVPKDERKRSTAQVVEEIRAKVKDIPGAEIKAEAADSSGVSSGKPIAISIRGDDLSVLADISNTIKNIVKEVDGTRNVETSLQNETEQFTLKVDSNLAAQYGVTASQIMSAVRTAFDGQVATQYRTGDDEIDIRVKFPENFKSEMNNIEGLMMSTQTGAQVAVGQVAKISKEGIPQQISRTNQTREVSVNGDITGRPLNVVNQEIDAKLAQLKLPDGYFIDKGGQAEDMAESFSSLGIALILAIALVYMVMASQFESLFYPFVIMFSIPPTFIGVVIGLLVTGYSLNVSALMGCILLVGIVVNNAIVLIDYINTLRAEGMERDEAVKKAGPVRLRPILMTTLTTVLAILPLAFGGGEGSESQAPMAIVVAFGLTFSTLVTLVLVPVVYTLFDDRIQKRRKRRMERREKRRQRREKKTGGESFNA
ncbi:efflux RND transporter permease subunit [Aneurinibacillus aneurinilyticus]|uniref:Efflux RND transporter permease subunit n=2 Tax=Aneurinibacillus aneurinilyticus TaxID=1391 RepID=A0A848CMB9_ANEAE|nr:efflux RND transporter permease subunit [Aneurinibacillus aneurinilyticus]ERI05607.1 heavy metal efflux pump, CzcA family [Aneurinibacillus aneurinilyticus ATCC 12856]MED0706238.1 efflux RND transporter permease subunit [Aneurinibacillus aneurinilyticus]MED0724192.1 efflux RND transporter permease subunit [Aneurinibacillus aneurinilyticus]MED0732236.1 efflux RND transporter permease subunit [Aneurinibacillus aneurinilyticus]MED0741747.1 efflux RND transporter permease subunit [Aneurinibacil